MITKILKWGNSQGLRLSRQLLEDAQIAVGDEVDVSVRHGVIVVAPIRHLHGKHRLRELVRRIPKDHRAEEIDWGAAVGKEVW